jgi:release factor glutamine methyltransferase
MAAPAPAGVVLRLRAAGCVFAEDEARLLVAAAATPDGLEAMVSRRVAGEPLEYVIGWAEFCGLRISVDPGVFVPRHRTEFLVDEATAVLSPGGLAVDLCCGAGAVGAALAARVRGLELHAADIDPAAVACARRNLAAGGARVYLGDLFAPLPRELRGRIDVLVANVPYVPSAEVELLPREARLFEARGALDGGADGLDVARRLVAEAPLWLAPGGHLLIETSDAQAPVAAELFSRSGLAPRVARLADLEATVVVGTAPEEGSGTGG